MFHEVEIVKKFLCLVKSDSNPETLEKVSLEDIGAEELLEVTQSKNKKHDLDLDWIQNIRSTKICKCSYSYSINKKQKSKKCIKFSKICIKRVSDKNIFHTFININNSKLMMEIDSGSRYNILSVNILKEYFPNYKNFQSLPYDDIYSVSGQKIKIESMRKLPIFVPSIGKMFLDFYIVQTPGVNLLGRNFIVKTKANVLFSKNGYYIKFGYFKNINKLENKQYIQNIEDIELGPNEVKNIKFSNSSFSNLPLSSSFTKNNTSQRIIINKISQHVLVNPQLLPNDNIFSLELHNGENFPIKYSKSTFKPIIRNISSEKVKVDDTWIDLKPGLFKNKLLSTYNDHCKYYYNPQKIETMRNDMKSYYINRYSKSKNNKYSFVKPNMEILCKVKELVNKVKDIAESSLIMEEDVSEKLKDINDDLIKAFDRPNSGGIDLGQFKVHPKQTREDMEDNFKGYEEPTKSFMIDLLMRIPISSKSSWDCGKTRDELTIRLKDNQDPPKNTRVYNVDFYDRLQIDSFISYLLFHKLAEHCPANMQFGAPVFLVNKKNLQKSVRLIVDSREINKLIEGSVSAIIPATLPGLNNIIGQVKYASIIDLRSCYYSIPLSRECIDKNISAIITHTGAYRLTSAITGLASVPGHLMQYLSKNLHLNSNGESDFIELLLCFYDDISVFSYISESLQDHLDKVSKVIERLYYLGFKIALDKCSFGINLEIQDIHLLGYKMNNKNISIPQDKIQSLVEFPNPTSLKSMQSFLGGIQYFRNMLGLQTHNSIAKLFSKTRTKPFQWDLECKEHFEIIKKNLLEHTNNICSATKFDVYLLFTDSSNFSIGGMLLGFNPTKFLPLVHKIKDSYDIKEPILVKIVEEINCECKLLVSDDNLLSFLLKSARVLDINNFSTTNDEFLLELVNASQFEISFAFCLPKEEEEMSVAKNFQNFKNNIINKKITLNDIFVENFLLRMFSIYSLRQIILYTDVQNKNNLHSPIYIGQKNHTKFPSLVIILAQNKFSLLAVIKETEHFQTTKINYSPDIFSTQKKYDIFFALLKENDFNAVSDNIKILGYYSKTLNATQISGTAICYKELYAVFECLTFFETQIIGKDVILLCDSTVCCNLLKSFRVSSKSSRLERLAQKISYWFGTIKIMSIGSKANLSDFMSRILPDTKMSQIQMEMVEPEPVEIINIYNLQDKKHSVNKIKIKNLEFLASSSPNVNSSDIDTAITNIFSKQNFVNAQIKECDVEDICPVSIKYKENKPMLPQSLIALTCAVVHSKGGHPGAQRLYNRLKNLYYVKNKGELEKYCKALCSNCLPCLTSKSRPNNYKKGTSFETYLKKPGQCVSMDILEFSALASKIGAAKYQVSSVLTIIDIFSKYITLYLLGPKTQSDIVRCLANYCQQNGIPERILSDNASNFKGATIRQFYKSQGIQELNSSPVKPQSRGVVERANGIINTLLRIHSVDSQLTILEILSSIGNILNKIPFPGTLISPYNLHHKSVKFLDKNLTMNNSTLFDQEELSYNIKPFDRRLFETRNEINDICKETRNLLMVANKKRLEIINKNKKEHKFIIHGYVFIKILSFSNAYNIKQKFLFSRDIHRILKVYKYYLLLENIISGAIITRHITHCKKLEPHLLGPLELPPEFLIHLNYLQMPKHLVIPLTSRIKINQSDQIEDLEDEDDENLIFNEEDKIRLLETIYE